MLKDAQEFANDVVLDEKPTVEIIREIQRNALEHAAEIVSRVGGLIHPVANSPCAQASQILRQEAEKLK